MDNDVLQKIQKQYSNLTVETILDWNEAFKMFDQDKNGSISASEVKSVLHALGQNPTENEVSDVVNELDVNQDGCIQFEEFIASMVRRNSLPNNSNSSESKSKEENDNLRAAFDVFDTDKNGRIDLKELRNLLKTLGEDVTDEQVHEMMTVADLDNNGTIDFEEFKIFMQT